MSPVDLVWYHVNDLTYAQTLYKVHFNIIIQVKFLYLYSTTNNNC